MRENVNRLISGKRILILTAIIGIMAATRSAQADPDDYYLYGNWHLGINYTTGIGGYVDTRGLVDGVPGAQYLFVAGGPAYTGHHYAYIYRVQTAGDPAMHPSNPYATGPIASRTFTQVGNPYYLGYYGSGHENAFYVNDTGIYYGADDLGGITHWDFGWTNRTNVAPPTPITTQTLAYHEASGTWWAGGTYRQIYRYDGSSWTYQFTHPNLSGDHHDGMEVIGNSLFISDMTSDVIIQYRLDAAGNLIDPANSPYKTFHYTAGPHVEGMGYGPNNHIWISGWSSGSIYEIGGGVLQEELETVPAPGALLLGTIGMSVAGWLRRRRIV